MVGLDDSAEIERLYPEAMERRRAGGTGWTRGEELEAMGRRVLEALLEIGDTRALVVTHGGPIREVWTAAGATGTWVMPETATSMSTRSRRVASAG